MALYCIGKVPWSFNILLKSTSDTEVVHVWRLYQVFLSIFHWNQRRWFVCPCLVPNSASLSIFYWNQLDEVNSWWEPMDCSFNILLKSTQILREYQGCKVPGTFNILLKINWCAIGSMYTHGSGVVLSIFYWNQPLSTIGVYRVEQQQIPTFNILLKSTVQPKKTNAALWTLHLSIFYWNQRKTKTNRLRASKGTNFQYSTEINPETLRALLQEMVDFQYSTEINMSLLGMWSISTGWTCFQYSTEINRRICFCLWFLKFFLFVSWASWERVSTPNSHDTCLFPR